MSRKRGNGEGSITKRSDGRFMARYTIHTAAGMKRKTLYGKTRAEVRDKLSKALSESASGIVFDAGSLTVGEYLSSWLTDVDRDSVRESTYERHRNVVDLHLSPTLGRIKLARLTPTQVQAFYRERLDHGLSTASVHKIHTVLHKALDQAVRWSLVPRNVTDAVSPPRVVQKEMHPLSREEVRQLLGAASGDRLEALYLLAIQTGMRQGELLALKWEDVDLEGAILRVGKSTTRKGGRFAVGETKTRKGRRVIHLTDTCVNALRSHLERQLVEIEALGDDYKDSGLIFTTSLGTLINPTNLRSRHFYPLLEKALLPRVRFHDLRHTCATLLLSKNVHPKFVQELLGHASISITLDTYSHYVPSMGTQTAKAMEEALS